jgi:hypothetical protein
MVNEKKSECNGGNTLKFCRKMKETVIASFWYTAVLN